MTTVRHHGTERPLVSYIENDKALKSLGIEWCDTKEVLDGKFVTGTFKLYGDQLPINRGASLHVKVARPSLKDGDILPQATLCRVIVQYMLVFRGRKGVSDITTTLAGTYPIGGSILTRAQPGIPMDPSALADPNQPSLFA